MNRREFVKTLAGLGVSIVLPLDFTLGSEAPTSTAWHGEADYYFEVLDYGTIWVDGFQEPKTRAEAYGGDARDFHNIADLYNFAENSCLSFRLENVYEAYRETLVQKLDAISNSAEKRQLKKKLKHLPEDPYDGWDIWLKKYPNEAKKPLYDELDKFLSEPVDSEEYESLPHRAHAQGAAFIYFESYEDWEVCKKLGIVIVQGEHPGSSYFAAELRRPIAEANEIAKELGLPYRFKPG